MSFITYFLLSCVLVTLVCLNQYNGVSYRKSNGFFYLIWTDTSVKSDLIKRNVKQDNSQMFFPRSHSGLPNIQYHVKASRDLFSAAVIESAAA